MAEDERLYSTGRRQFDARYCRTHAMVARMFAESYVRESNVRAWAYLAQAWADLAAIKQHLEDEEARRQSRQADGADRRPTSNK